MPGLCTRDDNHIPNIMILKYFDVLHRVPVGQDALAIIPLLNHTELVRPHEKLCHTRRGSNQCLYWCELVGL
jgi:hypothetical protein